MNERQSLDELLPHRGTMRVLAEVRHHDDTTTTCVAEPRDGDFFVVDGFLPTAVLLEHMAQTACVHARLRASDPVGTPLLLGTRELRLFVDRVAAGEELLITATCVLDSGELASYRCEARTRSSSLATATIQVQMRKPPQ